MEPDPNKTLYRRRRRKRSSRRIGIMLLCLSAVSFIIGVFLLIMCHFLSNSKLLLIGIIYILASVALLGIQGAMIVFRQIRRHEYQGE
jgi:VIT1/CCC1 family predicted Fe2+/Mn2+ transporter